MKLPFKTADIMIPKDNHDKWSVIACDQFTSNIEYWNELEVYIENEASALHIVLPEVYLENDVRSRINKINETMNAYIENNIFTTYEDALIYIERTLPNGAVRSGILGVIDLEEYDYQKGTSSAIRATEETILERIPPRVKIRKNAPLEMSHAMLFIDDPLKTVIEGCKAESKTKIYDFQLSMGGGSLKGYVLSEESKNRVLNSLSILNQEKEDFPVFAVGDGNHSLATAKVCYEMNKTELNRYAMAEIVNIYDPAICFEPIYRILSHVDVEEVLTELESKCCEKEAYEIEYVSKDKSGTLKLPKRSNLAVGVLQNYLDEYLESHPNVKIDYIHGEEVLKELAIEEDTIGFVFDGIDKSELFSTIVKEGVLPRKAFSMGDAKSKKYYMECRNIKN